MKAQAKLAVFTSYPTRCEWNNCFIKHKPLEMWVKMIFFNFQASESCHFFRIYTREIGGLFDTRSETHRIFCAFQTSLGFLCTTVARFVWFFEIELRPLLDLLNIVFTIIENVLLGSGEQRKTKNCRIDSRLSLTKWRYLFSRETLLSCRRVKTLQFSWVLPILYWFTQFASRGRGTADEF